MTEGREPRSRPAAAMVPAVNAPTGVVANLIVPVPNYARFANALVYRHPRWTSM